VQGTMWGNETIVYVDSYENNVLAGCFYNPNMPEVQAFHSTMDLLKQVEILLNEIRLPQSFSANRVFRRPAMISAQNVSAATPKSGKLGTFALRIMFRQNASWQGAVTWLEGKREESFRSVLELLLLIDSALDMTREEENET